MVVTLVEMLRFLSFASRLGAPSMNCLYGLSYLLCLICTQLKLTPEDLIASAVYTTSGSYLLSTVMLLDLISGSRRGRALKGSQMPDVTLLLHPITILLTCNRNAS